MYRRSTRRRQPVIRFGYNQNFHPYSRPRKEVVHLEGRRFVPHTAFTLPKIEEKKTQLKVQSVDLCLKRNHVEHRTEDYKANNLILRRGQPFHLNVKFDRDFKPDEDEVILEMRMGTRPSVSKSTRCIASVVKSTPDHDDWGIQLENVNGPNVQIEVFCSSAAVIGYYNLFICTSTKGEEYEFEFPEEVIMLFNAWCKDDGVHMADEAMRQEYVMNQTGMYFFGSKSHIGSDHWNYGQFEELSLDCGLYLLQKSDLTSLHRSSPIHVSRALSALVNSQDEDGVLVGRWDDNYSDGKPPTAWTGNIAILSQYMKNYEPVRYGQCWVFGNILTGLLRSLGLPTRTITNFASAHDTDGNLTLDYHYDEKLQPLDDYDEDSIWNFHVWNDCWMARPDLDEGYGGWQALDATPQETSHGVYCMGPSSLAAIKQGHVHLIYDTKFAFAEVNAEKVYWKVFKTRKPPVVIEVDPSEVGCNISTKAVGKFEREDITHQYKFKEGTELERIAVMEASTHVQKAKKFLKDIVKDVEFTVNMPDKFPIGKDIQFSISTVNKSDKNRNVFLAVTGNSVYYTGVKKGKVASYNGVLALKSKESKTVVINVLAAEYLPELTEYAGISFFIMGSVKQTQQPFSKQYATILDKPQLIVEVEGSIVQGKPFTVLISFTNPLPYPLTECEFLIEGPIIEGAKQIRAPNVSKHGEMSAAVHLTPRRVGVNDLIISFTCAKLSGVKGYASFNVKSA